MKLRHAAWALLSLFVLGTSAEAGTAVRETFASKTLGRDYPYTIYLPDGYQDSDLNYPVLYLLHGAGGNENEWLVNGKAQPTLDRLIDEGTIPPMIVVMPGHTNSWWVDANWDRAQTALIEDLVPHIQDSFRTIDEREGRLIGGLSAGGFGTVLAVLKYPQMFAAGAAMSPAIYVPLPPPTSSANRHEPFQKDGAFDPETWKRVNYPTLMESYKQQDVKVPLYINSGDHDKFDIAYHAAVFYQAMREHQPDLVEYRVVDGDHEWKVWEETLGDALTYMSKYVSRPRGTAPEAGN